MDVPMFCIRCKKATDSTDCEDKTAKNGRLYRCGKCEVCGIKKTNFIKRGETKPSGTTGGGLEVGDEDRPEMEQYAKLSASTYIPKEERQQWLHKEGLTNYLLDEALSDVENTVFYDPEAKKVVYGSRGSVSAKDWLFDDALIASGATTAFELAPRYRSTLKRIDETTKKYADYQPTLTGHSLGSTLISTAGAERNIPFRGFATGSSPMGYGKSFTQRVKKIFRPSQSNWLKENAKTYNVWTDPVSISDTLFPIHDSKHYNISKKKTKNPHSIENFFTPTTGGRMTLRQHCPI